MTDSLRIVEAQEKYFRSLTRTLNYVAGERQYLSVNGGFTEYSTRAFYQKCKKNGFPQFYLIDENDSVVGWCDIVARDGKPRSVGYIGIGLMPDYRERGIGTRMMLYAMDKARDAGFREIRLECRASNERALHVYKKLGFRRTAYRRNGLIIDGERIPVVCMRKSLL